MRGVSDTVLLSKIAGAPGGSADSSIAERTTIADESAVASTLDKHDDSLIPAWLRIHS